MKSEQLLQQCCGKKYVGGDINWRVKHSSQRLTTRLNGKGCPTSARLSIYVMISDAYCLQHVLSDTSICHHPDILVAASKLMRVLCYPLRCHCYWL